MYIHTDILRPATLSPWYSVTDNHPPVQNYNVLNINAHTFHSSLQTHQITHPILTLFSKESTFTIHSWLQQLQSQLQLWSDQNCFIFRPSNTMNMESVPCNGYKRTSEVVTHTQNKCTWNQTCFVIVRQAFSVNQWHNTHMEISDIDISQYDKKAESLYHNYKHL